MTKTNKILIGLGVVAAAGIGYYLWKRSKDSETKSSLLGTTATCRAGTCWCDVSKSCKSACCRKAAN